MLGLSGSPELYCKVSGSIVLFGRPKSGGKEISVPLKDSLLFATSKLRYNTKIGVV